MHMHIHRGFFIYLLNQKDAQLNAATVSFNAFLLGTKTFGYWPILFSIFCQAPAYYVPFHLLFSS